MHSSQSDHFGSGDGPAPVRRSLPQARYWIATIPESGFSPPRVLPEGIAYIKGQLEVAASGFRHWQLVIYCQRKRRLRFLRDGFGPYHYEPTRSRMALDYVWKDDTSVEGTRFELGLVPVNRAEPKDWKRIFEAAKVNDFESIPCDVVVRNYSALCRIRSDFMQAPFVPRTTVVYWGVSRSGKSFRAWQEAGIGAFGKDPNSKWWCGYNGQKHVVIDEFRGRIDIAHLLRWFDPYPVRVEPKGGSFPLMAEKFFITSNLDPRQWFPELDEDTVTALFNRLSITHFPMATWKHVPHVPQKPWDYVDPDDSDTTLVQSE